MKTHKPLDVRQPDCVCRSCGREWGLWWDGGNYSGPPHQCSVFQKGRCNVCGQEAGVTKVSNYGYLKEGWHKPLVD
jgi:ribosomal protein S14